MTAGTLDIPITIERRVTPNVEFNAITSTTATAIAETEAPERDALVEKLIALTLSPESLDWDLLARIDIEGWGSQPDPE